MARTLQLLRNNEAYERKELAVQALNTQGARLHDGEILIARYTDSTEPDSPTVKTIIGLVATGTPANSVTVFDSDAVPSEVQTAIDDLVKGPNGETPDEAYDTIYEISSALTVINGNENTAGSIKYGDKVTLESAKTYTDQQIQAMDVSDTAVARHFVTEVSETDGKIAVKRGTVSSTGGTITLTDNADGGVNLEVISSALTQYVGAEAIAVSEAQEGKKTISLTINTADKVLTQGTDGLRANITMTWSSTDGLKLIGKGGTEISAIPATDFIKDGMLESVTLEENPTGQTEGTYLHFVFNTDAAKQAIYLNVTDLIDIYTAGNGIAITGKAVSVKLDTAATEHYLTVDANGLKTTGITAAIESASNGLQGEIDKIETGVGLNDDGTHKRAAGYYTSGATTIAGEINALDGQMHRVGFEEIPEEDSAKTIVAIIVENEEAAEEGITDLANATGVLNERSEIMYVAPTVSGEFIATTSIMDMLRKIDEQYLTVDGGIYE